MSSLNTAKDEIKTRLLLSSVVGKRVKLTKAGREFKACCPFHNEKSPSFYVNDDKAFYHCFGCGAHGDQFSFVMQMDKVGFFEAMEQLAAEAGVAMPKPEAQDVEADKKRERLYQVNEAAARVYESLLVAPANADVMGYLTGRGLTAETIANFHIGYAPQDGGFLINALKDQGFTVPEMIESGLARETDGRVYSFFRDRVLFPVSDRRGRIIAFGGRILPEHLRAPNPNAPKYLNSADTPLFHKSHTLYAQALARLGASDGEQLIVVEGYMDAIALHQHGFKGAVAPLGTALTEHQIEMLWAMDRSPVKEPILAFDGDKAGRSAALRALDRALPLLKPGQSLKVLFLPEGEDPDTLLARQGAPAMRQLLATAQPLVEFGWDHWRGQMRLDTPESRAQARKFLRDTLDQIADPDVRALYRQELVARLDALTAPPVRAAYRPYGHQGKQGAVRAPQASGVQAGLLDQILTAALILCPQAVEHVEEPYGLMELADSELDKLRQIIISESLTWAAFSAAEARAYCEMKGFGDLVTRLMNNRVRIHAGFAENGKSAREAASGWLSVYDRRHTQVLASSGSTSPMDRLKRLARTAQTANDLGTEG